MGTKMIFINGLRSRKLLTLFCRAASVNVAEQPFRHRGTQSKRETQVTVYHRGQEFVIS